MKICNYYITILRHNDNYYKFAIDWFSLFNVVFQLEITLRGKSLTLMIEKVSK